METSDSQCEVCEVNHGRSALHTNSNSDWFRSLGGVAVKRDGRSKW